MFKLFHAGYYRSPIAQTQTADRKAEYYEIELYDYHNGATFINGERFTVQKNDIVIARPQDIRHSEGAYACHSLKFVCNDEQYKTILDSMQKISKCVVSAELVPLFNQLYRAFLLDREFECDAIVRKICSALYYSAPSFSPFVRYSKDIEKAVDYICDNLDKKLTLSSLSATVNLSPSFFHKVFRSVTGGNVGDFITSRRMEKAKELLIEENLSVDEITFRCGFSSRAYFDNAFKKSVGLTPVVYRNEKSLK